MPVQWFVTSTSTKSLTLTNSVTASTAYCHATSAAGVPSASASRRDPFLRHYSVETHWKLDFTLMNEAAQWLTTQDDFKAFCKAGADNKTTLCQVTTAQWVSTSPTTDNVVFRDCRQPLSPQHGAGCGGYALRGRASPHDTAAVPRGSGHRYSLRCRRVDACSRFVSLGHRILNPSLSQRSTCCRYKRNTMPSSTRARSSALALRLCSWKTRAPKRKLTSTLPRRIIDTMEIIAPGRLNA